MYYAAIFIHILVIILGIQVFIYDYRKNKQNKIRIFTGVNLVFIFIYGIVPIVMNLNNFFIGKTDFYLIYTVNISNEPYLFTSIIILIGYIFMILGYFLSKPYIKINYNIFIPKHILKIFGMFLLLVSCGSVLLVSKDLGGILNSFRYIVTIRSGEGASISNVGFMLLPVAIPSFLIFLSIFIENRRMISLNFLCMLISFLNSIYYVLIYGGRLPFALFLLIIPLYYLDKKNAFNIKNIIIIVGFGALLLNYLGPFFEFLSTGQDVMTRKVQDNFPRLIAQFSFPYINALKVHSFTYEVGEFRYFIDLVTWIYNNFIPNSIMDIFGLEIIQPSHIVNSNNHLTKGIPTDIISFGYYQFALPGVILVNFIFGKIIGRLDRIFNAQHKNVFIKFAQIRLFEILSFYPMYADIDMVTIMWANEPFDPEKPDTYYYEVKI